MDLHMIDNLLISFFFSNSHSSFLASPQSFSQDLGFHCAGSCYCIPGAYKSQTVNSLLSQTQSLCEVPGKKECTLELCDKKKTPACEPGVWPCQPAPLRKGSSFVIQNKQTKKIQRLFIFPGHFFRKRDKKEGERKRDRGWRDKLYLWQKVDKEIVDPSASILKYKTPLKLFQNERLPSLHQVLGFQEILKIKCLILKLKADTNLG